MLTRQPRPRTVTSREPEISWSPTCSSARLLRNGCSPPVVDREPACHTPVSAVSMSGEPWIAVQTEAGKPLPKPVTLAAIKAEPRLKEMALVKYSRLSVQPVTADEWKIVCKMVPEVSVI